MNTVPRDLAQAAAPSSTPSPMTAAKPAAPVPEKVPFRVWCAVVGSMFGAFMAILNIQITNSSLPDIQGGIGAGIDDGAWVSTSYLVGEIVVIPLADFLSKVFSMRRYLIASTTLFMLFSVFCGLARTLNEMILLRGLQGFFGGVLIPLAFTITITQLPPSKRPVGVAMFAMATTIAPSIGPTIGGFLTENLGWQYIFYLNVIPSLIMLALIAYGLKPEKMNLPLLREGDWFGIAAMAVGLSALQTMLEEGNRNDWFGSPYIRHLGATAFIALSAFVAIEFYVKKPVADMRLFTGRNFSLGTVISMLMGFSLYGSVYVVPVYLAETQGYNATDIGWVMAWIGLPQLIIIPFLPYLTRHFDARWIVCFGATVFALAFFLNLHTSPNYAGPQLIEANLVRAVGQSVIMGPMAMLVMVGVNPARTGMASGIYNMARNLGGAIGTALIETFITQREHYHSDVISAQTSSFSAATQNRLAGLKAYFLGHGTVDPDSALHRAIVLIGRQIHRNANILAFGDAFALMGIVLLGAAVLSLFLRKLPVSLGGH